MREKLIELISYARYEVEDICDERDSCDECPAENWCKDGYIADHLIANGVVISNSETATKWIPVTERLPEESGMYFVYTQNGNIMGMDYSAKYKLFNMYDNGIGSPIACSHWMPMP